MTTTFVSFDVWDALLHRRCKPEAVKLFTCQVLAILYRAKISQEFHSAQSLLRERHAVEAIAIADSNSRSSSVGFSLTAVIQQLLQRVGKFRPDELSEAVTRLVKIELEQLRFVSYPDPAIAALIREYDGVPIGFVSDDSVPSKDMAALLRFHNLSQVADRGVTCADLIAIQPTITLFDVARTSFNADPATWWHVGSASTANRCGATQLGIKVRPMPLRHGAGATPHVTVLAQLTRRDKTASLKKAASTAQTLVEHEASKVNPEAATLMRAGAAAAPLFAGFALWTLEQAIEHRSELVCFFAREGEFFSRVYEVIAAAYQSALPSPPHTVLSVSRLSTFAPSLDQLHPSKFAELWALYTPQTVVGFLATLGLETTCDINELAAFGLTPNEGIERPTSDPRLAALMAHPPFRERVMREISTNRTRLLTYLSANGLDTTVSRVTTIDIGWRGSIQSHIARLSPQTQFQGLYLGLEKQKIKMAGNVTKVGYAVDLSRSARNADLVTYVAPMEFLCSAAVGSTIGYTADTPAKPIRKPVDFGSEIAFANVVAPFQAGVIAGAEVWAREMRTHALTPRDLIERSVAAWRGIIEHPGKHMANGFADTMVDETFGFGQTYLLPREIGHTRESHGFSDAASIASMVRDTVRSIPWPQAFVHYGRSSGLANRVVADTVRGVRRGRRLKNQLTAMLPGQMKRDGD
jgi:FMN phosphatase YigB (HAD superfamily)